MPNQKTSEQGGATEEQIEAALDAWFSHEDEGIIDWLGTGSRYPTQDEQRRDLRPILTAVISAVAALPVDKRTEEQIEAAHTAFWAHPDITGGHDAIRAALNAAAEVSASSSAHPADERHDAEKREADAARALIVAIAEELTPGRRDKDLVIAARELRLKVERCEAEPEDHAATVTGDRELVASVLREHRPSQWRSFNNDTIVYRCCGQDFGRLTGKPRKSDRDPREQWEEHASRVLVDRLRGEGR